MCLIHRGVDEAEAVPTVNANIVANAATAVNARRALAMPVLLSLHVGHRLGGRILGTALDEGRIECACTGRLDRSGLKRQPRGADLQMRWSVPPFSPRPPRPLGG